jgi:hypothetical protein
MPPHLALRGQQVGFQNRHRGRAPAPLLLSHLRARQVRLRRLQRAGQPLQLPALLLSLLLALCGLLLALRDLSKATRNAHAFMSAPAPAGFTHACSCRSRSL